jgi:hydrophobe/amphiphile efflux-3 (HAE3) family protein
VSAARVFAAVAGRAVRRPLLVCVCALALGLAGAGLAVGLTPSTALTTFVEGSSPSYRATQSFYRSFGGEPIEIVVKGNLQRLLLSEDVERLVGLEGCLAGRVSGGSLSGAGGASGPCAQLARTRPTKVVIGPGTFINEAALQIEEGLINREHQARRRASTAQRAVQQRALARGLSSAEAQTLGKQAAEVVMRTFEAEVAALAVRFGITKPPSLSEPEFVSRVVFDSASKVPGTPKQRFAYLFPSREAALISVRLKAGMSQQQVQRAISSIRKAVAMPQWRLHYGSYLITGEPVILSELSSSITHSIVLLLIGAMLVMALMLGLVFRGRPRLAPLAIALLATAVTFGGLAASGATLSVGEVAVLPVLIGLAVDYAIQLQSRIQEALALGGVDLRGAVIVAARTGGPAIAAAAAASAGAMLVLELSPVPMVRDFALLLVVGLAVALLCAVSVGSAAIVLVRGGGSAGKASSRGRGVWQSAGASRAAPAAAQLRAAWRGAEQLVRENSLTRWLSWVAVEAVPRRPRIVLAVAAVLAALGWGLSSLTPVQTDITKLVPQSMPALRNLATLEKLSGVGGELDLMVSGRNLLAPASIEWMRSYQSRMLARFGYRKGRGCGAAPLCPALSLPDLLSGQETGASGKAAKLTAAELRSFLTTVPRYFSEEVISGDRRAATLAFGLRLMPLARQQRMIETMTAALHPPAGVHASLVGLPVLAAQADTQVASAGRRTLQMLLGLIAVALVLLIAFRGSARRALVPLVPVALASGWSALVLLILGVPLNPMSVTLGALVIAISTEFSVLLCERCREELREPAQAGDWRRAMRAAYRGTGAAVAASAATAIAGFGVLALSDIAMLRDFGLVTLIDLTVSLLGVLIVLPAALTLAYGRQDDRRLAGVSPRVAWRTLLRRPGARGGISA